MLLPCITQAFDLLESGVGMLEIDEAMTRFGCRRGLASTFLKTEAYASEKEH